MERKQSIGINGRGWTRAGQILTTKVEVKKEEKLTLEHKILIELKSQPFKRGVTYKSISKKHKTSVNYVRQIKLKHKL